jgi:membrane dipeptidase
MKRVKMNKKISEHVADLHRRAFTVDAHFDLTYEVANRRERGQRKVVSTDYLPGFKAGGFDLIVSAIFIHNFFLPEMGLRKALDQISCLLEEIDETPDGLRICRSAEAVRAAKADGRIGVLLSLEGADPLQNDLRLLRVFYELGVRGLGLVWSRRNYAGDGSSFKTVREGRKGGLTAFGVELIERAEALGMFIDVSHINDEGFWDVMEFAKKPVIASHSNCRSLAGSMRNLTDDQIKALAGKGGVMGVNSIDVYVCDDQSQAGLAHILDHVDHIVRLTGVEHVGVGLDLCGSFKNYLSIVSPQDTSDVIKGHAELAEFTAGLIQRGYSDDDILLILGGNFMRFYEAVLP